MKDIMSKPRPFKWYFSFSLNNRGKHSVLDQNACVMLDFHSGYFMFPETPHIQGMPAKS